MEIVEQVRQAANIIEIASQYTTLRARGHKHVGLCPFHNEKSPSFTVDADKQLYHCFGCGVGGDVFSLVMEKENLTFPEALRAMAERYHVPIPDQRKLSPQALKLEEQLVKLNESALAFFRKSLTSTQEGRKALEYLKKRGVSDEIIEEFRIGYAPNSWDAQTSYFKAKGVSLALLEQAGLALPGKKPGEYYDRFRGRVIFPIANLTGKIVGFGGRTLFNVEPKYLNSPDTPLYTKGHLLYGLNTSKDAIRQAGESILVEGYTDYLSLYQAGFRNVVASLGTALTPNQLALVSRFAPRILLAYDGDAAGQTASFRALPLLFEKGLEGRVLVLPENLDPDSFLKKYGAADFRERCDRASTGIQFFLEQSIRGQRMAVPEVKTRVLKGVLAALDAIPDAVIRSEYLRETAETLKIDEAVLRRVAQPRPQEKGPEADGELFPAERRLIQILIERQDLWPAILPGCPVGEFESLKSGPFFRIIQDRFRTEKNLILHELQKELDSSLSRQVGRALLEKGCEPSLAEALECLAALRRTAKETEVKRIQAEIGKADKAGDKDRVVELLRRKQDLTRELVQAASPWQPNEGMERNHR
ncbi:MAG: DNA primase [Candidatus Aminicenantes bacterium]|nr:DNA primase [Candidatus Aminicenantes bacterium]